MPTIRKFDVKNVNLDGKNLIEASAGTGKTYSIGILVLRLIIEKQTPIEKILMVTFTKAAVAELESRIRKFVRQAYKYSQNYEIDNKTIIEIVDKTGKQTAKTLLLKAVRCLDQLSVMTIHSYCEKCLSQYPFETRQSFDFTMATDISDIRDRIVNDYWRKKITTLEIELYRHFKATITRSAIAQVLDKALDDKEYVCEPLNEVDHLNQIQESITLVETAKNDFENHVRDNYERIKNKQHTNANANKFLESVKSSPAKFITEYIIGYKKGTKYIQNCFPVEYELCSIFLQQQTRLEELSRQYTYHLFKEAIIDLANKVTNFKSERGIIDFNDQIKLLHKAVEEGFVNASLASQYQAVFIDEFQDTDKHQYEIFREIFSSNTLFFIGDPKQSIYGWRKADIETYKRAKTDVDAIHSMNLNFRSTAELINALNLFFSIENPFYDDKIKYQNVDTGLQNLGAFTEGDTPVDPIDIYGFRKNPDIRKFVLNEVHRLLYSNQFKIKGERVTPSDIAIIVRTNKQAKAYKAALSELDIPAITIDDSKVLSSDEAKIILYLLDAVIHPTRGSINRVLLNPCFGIGLSEVEHLDDEKHLELFRELRLTWVNSGIYNMLFRFFDLYQVRQFGINMGLDGQRMLTNFYQIAEILHQAEMQNKYSPSEMRVWCQRAANDANDEYEQRVESQDDAVQITTIHKCKGLTYKIVFAPHLDLNITEYPIFEFRENSKYIFTHQPSEEQKKLWEDQIEQENRRLIYVALTRAQYKVYVCVNNYRLYNNSSIKSFPVGDQKQWNSNENGVIVNTEDRNSDTTRFSNRATPNIKIINTFGIHSFSGLSKGHHSVPFEKLTLGEEKEYDQFIFQNLGRGASVGTALHSIFERLNFNDEGTWDQTLKDASQYYPSIIQADNLKPFRQLIEHVMNVEIGSGGEAFTLKEVPNQQKLPEMEFFYSLDQFKLAELRSILGQHAELSVEYDLEGLMTGFIDLFFEHKGKYYILDWKSNFLGNNVEDYKEEGLTAAMKGSNYHLQYYIYTVAVKRYLQNKLPGFNYNTHFGGVIYLFLRGVRKGSEKSGVFFTQPPLELIDRLDKVMRRD